MKTIKNSGDYTIQLRVYGKLIEIPVNYHLAEEDFAMFDAEGRDEIIRYLAIKLLRGGYRVDLGGFDGDLICPCCGKKFTLETKKVKEVKEEPKIEPVGEIKVKKRTRKKK